MVAIETDTISPNEFGEICYQKYCQRNGLLVIQVLAYAYYEEGLITAKVISFVSFVC